MTSGIGDCVTCFSDDKALVVSVGAEQAANTRHMSLFPQCESNQAVILNDIDKSVQYPNFHKEIHLNQSN